MKARGVTNRMPWCSRVARRLEFPRDHERGASLNRRRDVLVVIWLSSPFSHTTLTTRHGGAYIQCRYMANVTQIAKWGNSLGLRLPKSVALEAQVGEGDTVDVSVKNGVIVVRPNR